MGFFGAFSVELPSTSNGEAVSDAGGLESPELESVAGATTTAAALFNEKSINAIAGFIKNVGCFYNSHLVITIQQTNAGSGDGNLHFHRRSQQLL